MNISCTDISHDYLIKKRFFNKDRYNVIQGLNLEIESGDLICIFGPNGCGKSTLLKIIAGIIQPSSGTVSYEGKDNSQNNVTMIFQEHGLFPWLNVIDNICFWMEMHGISKTERYEKAMPYINNMGLRDFTYCYPHQLSGGMKQKVNLIRGILMETEVLLIDEPAAGLDIYSKLKFNADIIRIWEQFKKTIIYVTHYVDNILSRATKVIIMADKPGRIACQIDIKKEYDVIDEKNYHVLESRILDTISGNNTK